MSADDETSEIDENRSNRRLGRTILFLIINGPTTLLALGLWVRLGARISKHDVAGGGDWMLTVMFFVWITGLVGSAVAIFKK